MKKLLFAAVSLDVGGIETALVTLLNYLAKKKKYDITLVLERKDGIFLDVLNKDIQVIEYTPDNNKNVLVRKIRNLIKQIKFKLEYKNKYDFSASYATYSKPDSFVARTASRNSVLWCHMDYLAQFDNDKKQVEEFFKDLHYDKFKKLVFVSEKSKDTFLQVFPRMKENVIHINNFINEKELIEKANEKIIETELLKNDNSVIFLNVGRHDEKQKKLSRIIEATKILKQNESIKGAFKVIFIGDGQDTKKYKELIKKYNLEDTIYLLGRKKNPYPYFKKANYVLLTSDYEGSPVVFTEAMILNVPIITTNVAGAEQLKDKYGVITTNNVEDIAKTMKSAIKQQYVLKEQFDSEKYNQTIKKQIAELIEKEEL